MLCEFRVYEAAEGKLEAMRARFKTEVVPRLPRRGIELLGVFEAAADHGRLSYLTRFRSEDDRTKAWAACGSDREWRTIEAATEVHGPLLKNQAVSVLSSAVTGLLLA